jgi:hypothetical protein
MTFVLDSISVTERNNTALVTTMTLTSGGGSFNLSLPLTNVPSTAYSVAVFNFTSYAEGASLLSIVDGSASSIHAVFSGHLVPSSTF